jgi:hypothetical protein
VVVIAAGEEVTTGWLELLAVASQTAKVLLGDEVELVVENTGNPIAIAARTTSRSKSLFGDRGATVVVGLGRGLELPELTGRLTLAKALSSYLRSRQKYQTPYITAQEADVVGTGDSMVVDTGGSVMVVFDPLEDGVADTVEDEELAGTTAPDTLTAFKLESANESLLGHDDKNAPAESATARYTAHTPR